jgi:hypothetical protein
LTQPRKLTFQEAWDSSTVFFVDEGLENEIDKKVVELLAATQSPYIVGNKVHTLTKIIAFLKEETNALDVILHDIGLSEEKFMRIISLLRKIGRIPGGFDSEWSMAKIKRELLSQATLMELIAKLLFEGKQDQELSLHIPRYYLDKLNYLSF